MSFSSSGSRIALALFFIGLGTLHFVIPDTYVEMMPPYLPWHLELVYLSGFFEIAGGVSVLFRPLRRVACWGLIALLIAVFPANIQYTLNAYDREGWSLLTIASIVRWPLQVPLIAWVWAACKER